MAQIEIFARTEIGNVRARNEDRFLVVNLATGDRSLQPTARIQTIGPAGTFLAVCDGMGGAAGGDVASGLAADSLARVLRSHSPFASMDDAQEALLDSVRQANRTILEAAGRDGNLHGMGTTVTGALVFGPELAIVHVGDSRAYLRRGRTFQQLTHDHSVVGQMVAAGRLTSEEARKIESRNVLLQALGVMPKVGPELVKTTLRAGDILMLCSDGLTTPLSDAEVLELLLRYEDPMRCCRALTEAACAAGGPDNITVLIARFTGEGLEVPQGREPIYIERRQVAVG
ncbi:MAG: protein phosphatase 2C domain-containing protein [Nannocystaceae bacterium]